MLLHGDDYFVTGESRGVWGPDAQGVLRLAVGEPASLDGERRQRDAAALPRDRPVIADGARRQVDENAVSVWAARAAATGRSGISRSE